MIIWWRRGAQTVLWGREKKRVRDGGEGEEGGKGAREREIEEREIVGQGRKRERDRIVGQWRKSG